MTKMDKRFSDRIDQATGKAKSWTGRATGDRGLEREGRTQSALAGVKIKLREAGRDIKRIVRARRGRRTRTELAGAKITPKKRRWLG